MADPMLLPTRAVLRIAGPDAAGFLQNLVTQDVPKAGEAAFAALLTPQGKIAFDFIIVAAAEGGFLVDCDQASADALAKRLSLYRLRAKVQIDRLDHAVTLSAEGEAAPEDAVAVYDDPRLSALGRRAILPAARGKDGEDDYDRRRLELGVPEFGKDFGADEVFLLDVNYDALCGVSYKKGCFVGQEVTSRMKRKGEVRKRTARLVFDGDAPPKGAPVTAGGSTLGEVMSGRAGAALALIRLDRLAAARETDASVEAAGKPVEIILPDYLENAR